MTIIELRDEVIRRGIESANKNETREYRKRGCLAGFELCRTLETPEQFTNILTERLTNERELIQKQVPTAEYWEYRCATVQIEFVFERLKILWNLFPQSARAGVQVVGIVRDQYEHAALAVMSEKRPKPN
jgi:hypothetical protein